MSTPMLVISIILIAFSLFLIVAVLMQQGKSHNLSGTIAGGAETFFGKSKAQTINKKLSIVTTVVAIVFVLLVTSVYIMQDTGKSSDFGSFWEMVFGGNEDEVDNGVIADTTAAETEAETAADTTAAAETVAETVAETSAETAA